MGERFLKYNTQKSASYCEYCGKKKAEETLLYVTYENYEWKMCTSCKQKIEHEKEKEAINEYRSRRKKP